MIALNTNTTEILDGWAEKNIENKIAAQALNTGEQLVLFLSAKKEIQNLL